MIRKVIKQANQAYTITLPIEWVRKNNIDKNNELEVEVNERNLILKSTGKIEHKKIKIDVSELHIKGVYRVINALYAKGIDEIELYTQNHCTSDIIKCLENTIGYALISKEKEKLIIKDIGGANYENLDEIFKRTFQMILSFYESAIEDIFVEKKETPEGLKARDREINKFALFLQRAINKMSYANHINGRALFTYSFELEKIGDEIERLWRTDIKYKIKSNNEVKKLAKASLETLEKVFESYFVTEKINYEEIYKIRDKLREDSMKIKADAITTRGIRHIIKIAEEAADLTHLTLLIKL